MAAARKCGMIYLVEGEEVCREENIYKNADGRQLGSGYVMRQNAI